MQHEMPMPFAGVKANPGLYGSSRRPVSFRYKTGSAFGANQGFMPPVTSVIGW
jgi:hypothetical protein